MDLESEAAQRVGTTLCNKWTLERLIGTGGMAAVYVATHKIGRREAIKILHSDVARDPELRARFEQEASAVNRFKHPGTVEVRDIDVAEDGTPFLVMELLDGKPLAELSRQPGGVPLPDLLRMVDEMLDVLAAAHAQGIIHRDIKPDNLFVLQDGRLKVLDFGIARVRAGAPPKLRTRVGATLGTAPYMPPEQIRGVEIDARADLFAAGATMFRLIAKRRIHEAANESETLVKMASLPAPPLASVAPDVPRDVCLVVDRALAFDREQRYPDALTMQGDVRAVREGRPPPYATARLEGSAFIPPAPSTKPATAMGPAPSDALTPDAPTRGAHAGAFDPRTAAASPGALLASPPGRPSVASDAPTLHAPGGREPVAPITLSGAITPPPASIRVPFHERGGQAPSPPADPGLDPATRPAMMVLGAAGLGAPLISTPAGAGAVNPAPNGEPARAAAQPSPAASAVGAQAQSPAPAPVIASGERTLRSVQGPGMAGQAVPAQGFVVGTTQMPAVRGPQSGASAGPRTQLSGVAPPPPPPPPPASLPLALGESIPVLPAPPPPKRRYTVPGTDISLWPLVGVGVVFAAIGVGITLWFMLRGPDPADMSTYPTTTAPTNATDPVPRNVHPPVTHQPLPGHEPGLAPQPTKGKHPR